MPTIIGPGAAIEFDVTDLEIVRTCVVMPVVEAMLEPRELVSVALRWGDSLRSLPVPGEEDLYVLIEAIDHAVLAAWIGSLEPTHQRGKTRGDVAWILADRMQDWVPERVAWGEWRNPTITLP